jgi:hypothetical protein
MNDLLAKAIEAHGGLDRWRAIQGISARVSITGDLWDAKKQAGVLDGSKVLIEPHLPRVTYEGLSGTRRAGVWEPHRVYIRDGLFQDVEAFYANPRAEFSGHDRATPWDERHLIHFAGYAMWTYVSTPFILAQRGYLSREVEPWKENGETWRRLEVDFPDPQVSHGRTQIFYFSDDGLLRRHDYRVDVLGGADGVNYASELVCYDGLVFASRRLAYPRGSDNQRAVNDPTVRIKLDNLRTF